MPKQNDWIKHVVSEAKQLQAEIRPSVPPPSDIVAPLDQPVLPHSLFRDTRGYLVRVVYQINRTYENTCYDACAVMIRRLLEMLIIETFEAHKLGKQITDGSGDYKMLSDLISALLSEPTWSLGREAKKAAGKLKAMGDRSAHSRRYNAKREYIDDVIVGLQVLSEELLYLSKLRT